MPKAKTKSKTKSKSTVNKAGNYTKPTLRKLEVATNDSKIKRFNNRINGQNKKMLFKTV